MTHVGEVLVSGTVFSDSSTSPRGSTSQQRWVILNNLSKIKMKSDLSDLMNQ